MTDLVSRLTAYVAEHRSVTFAMLHDDFEEFRGGTFDLVHSGPDHSNIVIWSGLTREAVEAYCEAKKEGRIDVAPTSPLIYLIDGRSSNLPLAKSKRHYAKPRWCPVELRPGPRQKGLATLECCYSLAA